MIKYILYFLSFLILSSCQSNNSNTLESHLGLDNIPLELFGQWDMEIDSVTAKHAIKYQYYIEDGKEYYISLNHFEPSIQFYSLDSFSIVDKIMLDVAGPSGIGNVLVTHSFFYVENLNSFWLYNYANHKIFNLNRNGEILKVISTLESFNFVPEGYHNKNLWVKNGYLYAIGNIIYNDNSSILLQGKNVDNLVNTIMVYELSTDSVTFTFPHPDIFKSKPISVQDFLYYVDYNVNTGKYLISFPFFSDILVTSDFKNLSPVPFGKTGVPDLFETYPIITDQRAFYLTADRYTAVYYDPYREWYIRLFKAGIPQNQLKQEDNILSPKSKKYILIFDKYFNPLFEWEVTNLRYWDIFFGEKGIYIGEGGEDNDEDVKTYLIFSPKTQ